MKKLVRALPLWTFAPFRQAATRLPRGNPLRSASIVVLRSAMGANLGRLGSRLTEVRPADAPHLRFAPTDSQVIDAVYWLGLQGYEGVVAEVWHAICAEAQCVLEIGGNVGLFTVVGAAAGGAQYTVLEPVGSIAEVLQDNLRRNGLDSRVTLRVAAAIPGHEECEVVLNVPAEGRAMPTGAHLLDAAEIETRSSERHLTVPGLPIRSLMAGQDAVKIDAEGVEAQLLHACRSEIALRRPALLLEVLPEATQLATLISELAGSLGYTISMLPEWGRHEITEVAPAAFHAGLPSQVNSKNVLLSIGPAPRASNSRAAATGHSRANGVHRG